MAEAVFQSFLGSVNAILRIFLSMRVALGMMGVSGQIGAQNTCPFLAWSVRELLQVVSGGDGNQFHLYCRQTRDMLVPRHERKKGEEQLQKAEVGEIASDLECGICYLN